MLKRLFYVLYFTLLVSVVWIIPGEVASEVPINITPFKTIRLYITAFIHGYAPAYIIIINLIGNIVLFIPLGILLFSKLRHVGIWSMVFYSLYIPTFIETVQLVLHLLSYGTRTVDIDDVLLNMCGIWFGYSVAFIVWKYYRD